MMRLTIGATLVCTALLANTAFAGHETIKPHKADSLGKCVKAALTAHEGKIVRLEMKSEDKKPVYEFDILEADHEEVKVEVDATPGKIVETSYEVYQIGKE